MARVSPNLLEAGKLGEKVNSTIGVYFQGKAREIKLKDLGFLKEVDQLILNNPIAKEGYTAQKEVWEACAEWTVSDFIQCFQWFSQGCNQQFEKMAKTLETSILLVKKEEPKNEENQGIVSPIQPNLKGEDDK